MKINIHTSHPSAFISSTFLDLKNERRTVSEVLRDASLNINALDVKPASSDSSKVEIIRGIKESDIFILIVADRYGSIIPQMTKSDTLSITRWEYNQARLASKSILVYFRKTTSFDFINFDDKEEKDYNKKTELLAYFKKILSDNHNPKYFSTPEELAKEVKEALIPTYRNGVKKLLENQKNYQKEIESLKADIDKYRLQATSKSHPSSGNALMDLGPAVGISGPRAGLLAAIDMSALPKPALGMGRLGAIDHGTLGAIGGGLLPKKDEQK